MMKTMTVLPENENLERDLMRAYEEIYRKSKQNQIKDLAKQMLSKT